MNKILCALFALLMSCTESPVSASYEQDQAVYCYENRLVEIQENLTCLSGLVCLVQDLESSHRQLADVNHLEPSYICK
jgi:hypothetical protein